MESWPAPAPPPPTWTHFLRPWQSNASYPGSLQKNSLWSKYWLRIIHYTTSEFKYVVNRRGEAESINCIFKLASGVIILSRAAKPKKEKKTASSFHGEFRAVVYQIDNHHMWIKFQVNWRSVIKYLQHVIQWQRHISVWEQGLRHRGDGGDASPHFWECGDNPPIFRKIVGQIRWVFGFWYGLPSEENPGFAAAWSPSPHFHRRGGAPVWDNTYYSNHK